VGGDVVYHLVVANAGPDAAQAVTVTDTLPAGVVFISAGGTGWTCTHAGNASVTCTTATIASSATAPTITLVVRAPASVTTLANAAVVTSSTPDPTGNNNSSSATTAVLAAEQGHGGGPLPHTGADLVDDVRIGLGLLLLGLLLLGVTRRRNS